MSAPPPQDNHSGREEDDDQEDAAANDELSNLVTDRRRYKAKEQRRRHAWSAAEDQFLLQALAEFSPGETVDWVHVSMFTPGRTHASCQQRYTKVLRAGLKKGTWSPEEDEQLLALLDLASTAAAAAAAAAGGGGGQATEPVDWGEISKGMSGRTPKQCRERWKNVLDPTVRRGRWNEEEDEELFELYAKFGPSWSVIAQHMGGFRNENMVKNRWRRLGPTMRGTAAQARFASNLHRAESTSSSSASFSAGKSAASSLSASSFAGKSAAAAAAKDDRQMPCSPRAAGATPASPTISPALLRSPTSSSHSSAGSSASAGSSSSASSAASFYALQYSPLPAQPPHKWPFAKLEYDLVQSPQASPVGGPASLVAAAVPSSPVRPPPPPQTEPVRMMKRMHSLDEPPPSLNLGDGSAGGSGGEAMAGGGKSSGLTLGELAELVALHESVLFVNSSATTTSSSSNGGGAVVETRIAPPAELRRIDSFYEDNCSLFATTTAAAPVAPRPPHPD